MKGCTNIWINGTVSGEKVYINLITNQLEHSDLNGTVITVS